MAYFLDEPPREVEITLPAVTVAVESVVLCADTDALVTSLKSELEVALVEVLEALLLVVTLFALFCVVCGGDGV